ncbi:CLUMA_CG014451, isoform A [Clunio marinus]|uniref:HECT-type E3 ubiquitin transferase n=1 Tax=Clunio marinus TaxID=568069 RepID=A0A1J1IN48_9DIPT|nr:CLUMA_CG014451, isoform A [Clunio marinus]
MKRRMKVDTSRLKKGTSEVPPECQNLIDKLKACDRTELIEELSKIETWTFGKCELFHWIDILDIFDEILEEATHYEDNQIYIMCDSPQFEKGRKLLLLVLNFTTLLIEHSFSRHLYNSVEHLTQLLLSTDLEIILGVLNLLYMFSKRSNFISRLSSHKKSTLLSRLKHIAEPYGGKECGFGLADCCRPDQKMPKAIYHFYYEYYTKSGALQVIDHQNISKHDPKSITVKLWKDLDQHLDDDQKYHLFARARLATGFWNYENRILFVQARLQALSILVYSDALMGYTSTLIYPGFLEELVELLELQQINLVEIRAAALRTLTAIIHLERNSQYQRKSESRLNTIIEVTGASSYHGFLPTLVRNCIANLTGSNKSSIDQTDDNLFPLQLATALFSFLYHLASYEPGAESLVSCGMMESLLRVINWSGSELEHITFVTRAVRVIDLITNIDMQSFQSNYGLNTFIKRLNMEVNLCRKEQSYEIKPNIDVEHDKNVTHIDEAMDTGSQYGDDDIFMTGASGNLMTTSTQSLGGVSTSSSIKTTTNECQITNRTCLPQRAALLKSMLNFLKKAIQDIAFSDSIRHIMEGTLPESLKHIISNSEYYGPSLFLLATDVVTVYVFQEPSLLSSLQDNGLTDVVLQALLKKDVPATREVLGSLPNVFSALCLNTRGLESFVKYNPFEKLFRVLTSPVYLSAMRRRRSSDPMGDTASNIGNAMDELMRNQPSLKTPAIKAIIKLLEEIVELGTDPKYICWRAQNKNEVSPQIPNSRQNNNNDNNGGSSDEDDEDEEEVSTSSHNQTAGAAAAGSSGTSNNNVQQSSNVATAVQQSSERVPIALIDYTLNTMKFLEAILSNNSTDDHCREFVTLGGLRPLLTILSLQNFPVTSFNSPITATAQAVASVCKSILNLTHESQVLQVALEQLSNVVELLKPLMNHQEHTSSSVLLKELANCQDINHAFTNAHYTPLLHAMSAVHGYVVMLVHVCRSGQSDIRTLSLMKWGQDNNYGMQLLKKLVMLYTGLVWESTLLLALCTDDIIPPGSEFGKDEMEKLGAASDLKNNIEVNWDEIVSNLSVMENLTPGGVSGGPATSSTMDVDNSTTTSATTSSTGAIRKVQNVKFIASQSQLKYIKSLLGASSRLGRALAELFGLLVRLCVGSPLRQRRGQNFIQAQPFTSPTSREIARVLSFILVDGLSFNKLPSSPVPKLKLTFLICSIGFTSPMLFDEKRFAYHLMLQKFIEEGGLEAFFEMFRWTLTAGYTIPIHRAIEHPNLPDGTGEALDAWLMLLEKMVNLKYIIESPHQITSKTRGVKTDFDTKHYLTYMHRNAFLSIQHLWGYKPLKSYGLRMTESMLSILKHIIKEHLRQLVDMGFSCENSINALRRYLSLEGATEYLLTNPRNRTSILLDVISDDERTTTSSLNPATIATPVNMDIDVGEEDEQVIRAILNSLGSSRSSTPINPSTNMELSPGTSGNANKSTSNDDEQSKATSKTKQKEVIKKYLLEQPLPKKTLDDFTQNLLKTCLNVLDQLPETVYKICDLLITVTKRNGPIWRDEMLDTLCKEIYQCIQYLIGILVQDDERSTKNYKEKSEKLVSGDMANKTAVRIHLFTLFFQGHYQDMKVPCANALKTYNIIPRLIKVLTDYQMIVTMMNKVLPTPKWLAPLALLLDLYDKVALSTKQKQQMHKICTTTWQWYDISSSKWNSYSPQHNKMINDAYMAGESEIHLVLSRHRYIINFKCMSQINEESSNHRPIIMALRSIETMNNPTIGSGIFDEKAEEEEAKTYAKVLEEIELEPLSNFCPEEIVSSCVQLMAHQQLDRDTLHAIMRVVVRLTKNYSLAEVFARFGGIDVLLNMKQNSGYIGFTTLATLLIRHVIEEPKTLSLSIQNVLANRTLTTIPPGHRELLFLIRQLNSAVYRDPQLFKEAALKILRVDFDSMKRSQITDEKRFIMKSIPLSTNIKYNMEHSTAMSAVCKLLKALIEPDDVGNGAGGNADTNSCNMMWIQPEKTSTRDGPRKEKFTATNEQPQQQSADDLKEKQNGGNNNSDKPLLSKSAILKILAESVKSYQTVALYITEHKYRAGMSAMINEDTTALSFILDRMLHINDANMDRECPAMAQSLISAIASSDVTQAQETVVQEVKWALQRALNETETNEKHLHIEGLATLIPAMIENNGGNNENNQFFKVNNHSQLRHNIFYIMLEKGIITDIARAVQYLELGEEIENDDEEEEEAEERSELDEDEETQPFEMYDHHMYGRHLSPSIPEIERDHEDILMIQYSNIAQNNGNANNNTEARENRTVRDRDAQAGGGINISAAASGANANNINEQPQNFLFNANFPLLYNENSEQGGNDNSNSAQGAPSNASNEVATAPINTNAPPPNNHPLLSGRPDGTSSTDRADDRLHVSEGSGLQTARRRGARRYQLININSRNPPVILQRMLELRQNRQPGQANAASGNGATPGNDPLYFRDGTRVVVMDNGFSIFSNDDLDFEMLDQTGYWFGRTLANHLNNHPSALGWWQEENKISGPDSNSDLCMVVCDEMIPELDAARALELSKIRGKRKKKALEEDEMKQRNQDGKKLNDDEINEILAQREIAVSNALASVPTPVEPIRVSDPSEDVNQLNEDRNVETMQYVQLDDETTTSSVSQSQSATNNLNISFMDVNEEAGGGHQSSSHEPITVSTQVVEQPQHLTTDNQLNLDVDIEMTSDNEESSASANNSRSFSPNYSPNSHQIETSSTTGGHNDHPMRATATTAENANDEIVTGGIIQDMDPAIRAILGDLEVPEGVHPSFLAALPPEMRDEVIQEHLRQQRIRQRAQQTSALQEAQALADVNPEFLAALPLNIQEEVLAQQRMEQQRQAAAAANPNDPVNAAEFFQNLQPSLRQTILADMEDSQIAALPPDLAAEAQNLRRDWETRNRQMQERILTSSFTHALRNPGNRSEYRLSNLLNHSHHLRAVTNQSGLADPRVYVPRHNLLGFSTASGHSFALTRGQAMNATSIAANMERHGAPLLDQESLASILVLLFIDDTNIATLRLYRVIRNLCFHIPTRKWIIKSLLSIITRCNEESMEHYLEPSPNTSRTNKINQRDDDKVKWLKLRLDSALGGRANVFLKKYEKSLGGSGSGSPLTIHPKASPTVCRHTLDLLIFLAKSFPAHFLPLKRTSTTSTTSATTTNESNDEPMPSTSAAAIQRDRSNDFWDILMRLDNEIDERSSKKGAAQFKAICKQIKDFNEQDIKTFTESPFGQLIIMLSFDIIRKNSMLTDKLLRLLSLISIVLTDDKYKNNLSKSSPSSSSNEQQQVNNSGALSVVNIPPSTATTTTVESNLNEMKELSERLPESEDHLALTVEVLTSKSCSEDGLEDATALLINLSQCSSKTKYMIINLLVKGVIELSHMVQKHINNLMVELRQLNDSLKGDKKTESGIMTTGDDSDELSRPSTSKGLLRDRFTKDSVIITAPSKVKTSNDLQLPSMAPLLSKTSNQSFFLRILKVITNIRDTVRQDTKTCDSYIEQQLTKLETVPLSELLNLDSLWNTLSDCLKELEETQDHHAVLVLQPAVEAFFIVHSAPQVKSGSGAGTAARRLSRVGSVAPTSNTNQEASSSSSAQVPAASSRSSDNSINQQQQPSATAEIVNNNSRSSVDRSQSGGEENANNNQPSVHLNIPIDDIAIARQSQHGEAVTSTDNDQAERLSPMDTTQSNATASSASQQSQQAQQQQPPPPLSADQKKFLQFAETHRVVLNQILRQSSTHLADGPFAVLVDHTRVLDFDVKRRYFRIELERLDDGIRREELAVHVHRVNVFEDSFRELYRRNPEEWKNRFYIVFEDEEGQDAGGLLREWYMIISREIFNPMYALFTVSPGDRVTYMINPSSHCNPNHLCYFKFVGRVIAKAIYDNKLLECYFTRAFYKHILGIQVKYTDMESEDYAFYQGLVYLIENRVDTLGYDLTFSLEIQEFGVTEVRELIPNGGNIAVTEENKLEYIQMVCQLKMSGSIKQQLNAFLEGFYDIIPKRLISIFNEQELELLISGLPNIDIEDLRANTEYHKYQATSIQIQWFWRALRSFDQAERAKFLQFVTGTSKVPLQGFGALEGMNGIQKFQIHRDDRSTDRLPSAHTCFNQLDLPVYKSYDKLRTNLLKAIHECSEGFGFA